MSLSPVALEALRAAQSVFSESEADVFEDALARGMEAVDREGRLVGAYSAAELVRLRDRVAELEKANAGLDDLRVRALDKNERIRVRLAAAETDLLNVRGLLSPAGEPRRIPAEIEIHERVAPAVEWLLNRVAELEAAQGTVFRASHDSIVMGRYTTATEARKHCEAELRREWPDSLLDWIEDEEDGVAELVAETADGETPTGYVVTALEIASVYDEGADE